MGEPMYGIHQDDRGYILCVGCWDFVHPLNLVTEADGTKTDMCVFCEPPNDQISRH